MSTRNWNKSNFLDNSTYTLSRLPPETTVYSVEYCLSLYTDIVNMWTRELFWTQSKKICVFYRSYIRQWQLSCTPVVSSSVTERLWTEARLKWGNALTQTDWGIQKSVHLPSLLSFLMCPIVRLSLGQIWQLILNCPEDDSKRSAQADSWENAPFLPLRLSSGRRQQHLLTWPYLSQALEGIGYSDNSSACISFIFEPTPKSLSLSVSSLVVPGGIGNGPLAFYLRW